MDDLERELRRVVDRLSTMPLAKAESSRDAAHRTAVLILERTRALDPSIPGDAQLPLVGVSAMAAQLSVVGADFIAAARRHAGNDGSPTPGATDVLDALVQLRRSLP